MLLQVLIAPLLVYFGVGDKPSSWTVGGGALLLIVLAAHELIGMRRARASQRQHVQQQAEAQASLPQRT